MALLVVMSTGMCAISCEGCMQVICCTHSYLFLEKMNLLGEAEVAVAVAVAAVAAAAAAALAFGTLEQACHGVVGVPEHCHQ